MRLKRRGTSIDQSEEAPGGCSGDRLVAGNRDRPGNRSDQRAAASATRDRRRSASRPASAVETAADAGRRPSLAAAGRSWRWSGCWSLHYALAAQSLLQENPTVDEVVHLPAGVTYWQKGTFQLYHHNPPLFKLVAALPVVWPGR